ncbi:protein Z, vitamin K-dependent plasma glycoprotein b [Pelmatolapia mariae]|uniref:protein Z, vitamin K-dependent plasma glycoprotein b n=1 Tax=Pelmatolapia mariae TaxID=158779 RepID=UPI002FE58ECE
MAVSIMSASLLLFCLLQCFLQIFSQGKVFRSAPEAHAVFLRPKRANSFILEEILQGNLERECYEEQCNFEEAREYFEDTPRTITFWAVYSSGNHCLRGPCLNGGNCTHSVRGFTCSCNAPYYGPLCELKVQDEALQTITSSTAQQTKTAEISKCPTESPTACHQLCTVTYESFRCSCMSGFKLHSDGRSCLPEVEFPCGRLPEETLSMCHHGNCPWQVSLLNSTLQKLCSGVVLGQRSILTSARCLYQDSEPKPSNLYVLAEKQRTLFPVKAMYLHNGYHKDHHENDLVLIELADSITFSPSLIHLCLPTKDFSENVLMHSGRTGITESWEISKNQKLVYMTLDDCRRELNIPHPLSNKMFCMRKQNEPLKYRNETQESPGAQRHPNVHLEIPKRGHRHQNRPLGNQIGVQGRLHGRTVNRLQNQTQNTNHRLLNKTASYNHTSKALNFESSHGVSRSNSEPRNRPCGGLMPGSPVATVEQGTVFLTGLLISSPSECEASGGGLVFSKLSRYLSWIRMRLEVIEKLAMTPQVRQYPEAR